MYYLKPFGNSFLQIVWNGNQHLLSLHQSFSLSLSLGHPNLLEKKLSIDLGGDAQATSIVLCALGQSSISIMKNKQKNHIILTGLGERNLSSFSSSLQFIENTSM